jgi:hypothetical protein
MLSSIGISSILHADAAVGTAAVAETPAPFDGSSDNTLALSEGSTEVWPSIGADCASPASDSWLTTASNLPDQQVLKKLYGRKSGETTHLQCICALNQYVGRSECKSSIIGGEPSSPFSMLGWKRGFSFKRCSTSPYLVISTGQSCDMNTSGELSYLFRMSLVPQMISLLEFTCLNFTTSYSRVWYMLRTLDLS